MINDDVKIVIPARKNSSRFPLKHFKLLGEKKVYEYTFEYAIQNAKAENIWVNTDDEKLIQIAIEKGFNFIKRPSKLANDFTPTIEVLKHQIDFFNTNNIPCTSIILMQLTNPFRPEYLLKKALKIFEESKNESLATFSRLDQKVCHIFEKKYKPVNYIPGMRSQDITPLYYENGLLYISSCNAIKNGQIITDDVYPLIISDVHAQVDIDNKEDLILAEYILNKIKI